MSWYWLYQPTQAVWVPPAQPFTPVAPERHIHFAAPTFKQTMPPPAPQQVLGLPHPANIQPAPPQQNVSYYYPQAPTPISVPQYAQQQPYPHPYQYGPPAIAAPPPHEKSKTPNKFWYVPHGQAPNAGAHGHNVWHGRSSEQVQADDHLIGMAGGYAPHPMAPHKPKSDQIFQVLEPDGTQTWRNARTIDEMEGHWGQTATGQMYFARQESEASDSSDDE